MNKSVQLGVIVAAISLIALLIHLFEHEVAVSKVKFRLEQSRITEHVAQRISGQFDEVYSSLRTIARLPGVRRIDRYANTFSSDSRLATQEIYNNLSSRVHVSEIYIVPLDFDPDQVDPVTHRNQTPITTFDAMIVGKVGGNDEADRKSDGVDEVEIYEYRVMKSQLRSFRSRFATESSFDKLEYPAATGPEVITCDNSKFDPKHPADENRSGLVYSVPFYDESGKLKGCVSAVFLTSTLTDLLPNSNYGLVNTATGFAKSRAGNGEFPSDKDASSKAVADSKAIYSESKSLPVKDTGQDWYVWVRQPDSVFWTLPEVSNSIRDRWTAVGAIVLGAGFLCWFMSFLEAGRRKLVQLNQQLTQQVEAKTNSVIMGRRYDALGKQANSTTDKILKHVSSLDAKLKVVIKHLDDLERDEKFAKGQLSSKLAVEAILDDLQEIETALNQLVQFGQAA